LSQRLDSNVSIFQLAAFGLRKALRYMSSHSLAMFEHPVFEIKLLADNLKRLFDHLGRVFIGPGSDRQVDHTLLLRF
jgi:hypothetical protein